MSVYVYTQIYKYNLLCVCVYDNNNLSEEPW